MMSVSVAGIQKNRCRTTVAEPIGENASGTALYRGTRSVCLGRNNSAEGRSAEVVPHLARRLPRGFVARIYVSVALALGRALFCCGEDLRLGARERPIAQGEAAIVRGNPQKPRQAGKPVLRVRRARIGSR